MNQDIQVTTLLNNKMLNSAYAKTPSSTIILNFKRLSFYTSITYEDASQINKRLKLFLLQVVTNLSQGANAVVSGGSGDCQAL